MGTANIMIVEDNTTVAADCQDCLTNLGYNVTSIQASGEDAILKTECEMPDAVLMDIYLRDKIDGITAAEQIYQRFQIPVVFLSAYNDQKLLQRAKQVGSFGYLIKPFRERELYATLEMALYKSKAEKEHKQMKAQIRLLHKMESIGILAGGLAHDFNNLLYVVLGNIGLAEENLQYGISASENLIEAKTACLRANKLTKKLIAFSKGSSLDKKRVNMGELVIKQVISTLKGSWIKPEFFIQKDISEIDVDINKIKDVVDNITINAKEAMSNQGVLKISGENVNITRKSNLPLSKGKYLKLSFEDQGSGISNENLEKIFDPYFSTKEMSANKGQGLGLAICYSIVTRHNGLIKVHSKLKRGSTFSIFLPAFPKTLLL